jgi:thioredoxin 1
MKTPIKLLIVAALAVAVIAAVALNKNKPAVASTTAAPALTGAAAAADLTNHPSVSAAKLPRLIDLGADKCIPCRMMFPVLDELKQEYAGKLNVEFIDVWKNPDAAKQYGVEVIPTQIFYDAAGKELFRHEGFFAKADILAKWQALGVDLAAKPAAGK